MTRVTIASGLVHRVPSDLRKTLTADAEARNLWNALTPLARNEWICWIRSVKKPETRNKHIVRTLTELKEGKSRPCCWIGCIHRRDKPASPSVRGILNKRHSL